MWSDSRSYNAVLADRVILELVLENVLENSFVGGELSTPNHNHNHNQEKAMSTQQLRVNHTKSDGECILPYLEDRRMGGKRKRERSLMERAGRRVQLRHPIIIALLVLGDVQQMTENRDSGQSWRAGH